MARSARALRVTAVQNFLRNKADPTRTNEPMGSLPRVLTLVVLAAAFGCGGGGGTSTNPIVRIEVSPVSQLLTQDRREAPLTAIAYDADGNVVDTTFTWVTSTPAQIAVDSTGKVSALAPLGSAAVWAEAGELRSRSALVASVELHPGTLAVTDAQVVEIGDAFLPPGEPDGPAQLDVRLRDLAVPGTGTVLVSTESAPVGGVVVSATPEGSEVVVRLRSATVPELYARYDLDWQLALADYDIEMIDTAPLIAGLIRPVETTLEKQFPSNGQSAFQCSASLAAKLEKNLVNLQLVGGAKFIFKSNRFDSAVPPGYLKVAIEGPLTLKGFMGLKIQAGFNATARCELEGSITIYMGAFSVIAAPSIPLGVGVEVSADITVATLEVGFEGENGFDLGVGFECGRDGGPCAPLGKFDLINKFTPKLETPDGMDDTKTTLTAKAYFLSGIDIEFLLGAATFKAVKATFGPVQTANLASVRHQINDTGYASDYKLDIEAKLEPGDGFNLLFKHLLGEDSDVARLGATFTLATDISKSPHGTMTVDKTSTGTDQPVHFTFNLSDVTYWLLGFNVTELVIYKKHADAPFFEEVDRVQPTSSNQMAYTWTWTPVEADLGTNKFVAFVKTTLPVFQLEIAADSAKTVEVVPLCGPSSLTGLVPGPGGQCQVNGSMTHTMVAESPVGTTTTTTSGSVTMQVDPALTGPGVIGFRPTGTWSNTHNATLTGCTLDVFPAIQTGLLDADPTQGAFLVWTDEEPMGYSGLIATGAFMVTTTITCPPSPPYPQDQMWDFNMFKVDDIQNMTLDANGRAMGSYTTIGGTPGNSITDTWTWDLTLSVPTPPPPPPALTP
jgi:hypothetical protein